MRGNVKYGVLMGYVVLIANCGINIITTPYIVHQLGDSEYGLYKLIGSMVATFSIMDFGIGQTVVRYIAQYRLNDEKDYIKEFLTLVLFLYSFISLILIVAAIFLYGRLDIIFIDSLSMTEVRTVKSLFIILVLNLAITIPGGIFTSIVQGYERFTFNKICHLVRIILRIILILTILFFSKTSITLALIDSFLNGIIIIINYLYCKFKLNCIPIINVKYLRKNSNINIKEILLYSIWLFLDMIVGQILSNVDNIIIGIKMSSLAVSIYAIGSTFSSVFQNVATVVSGVILPRVIYINKYNDKNQLSDFFVKISRMQMFVVLFILEAFYFLGLPFIRLWIGSGYDEAWYSALAVMVGYTPALIENAGFAILKARNKHWVYTMLYFLVLLLNIGVTYIAVDYWGIRGAAFVTMFSLLIGNFFVNLYYKIKMRLNVTAVYLHLLKTCIFMMSFTWVLKKICLRLFLIDSWLRFLLVAVLYTALYVVLSYFFVANTEEKAVFKKIAAKIILIVERK